MNSTIFWCFGGKRPVEKVVEGVFFFVIGNMVKYTVNQQVMESCDFEHVQKHTSMETPRMILIEGIQKYRDFSYPIEMIEIRFFCVRDQSWSFFDFLAGNRANWMGIVETEGLVGNCS